MKLSEFRARLKLALPNLGQAGLTPADLTSLINQACNQANLIIKAYVGYTDFNVVANQREYDLSVVAPRFIGRDKRGLFFKVSGEWQKIDPRTESYLSEFNEDYLNSTSTTVPDNYYISGQKLGFDPPANADQVNGIRLYHLMRSVDMVNDDHYPFSGSTSEIPALLPMDNAIIAWCKWQIAPAYGSATDVDLKEREFLAACMRAERQIKSMPDVTIDCYNRMRS